MVTKMGKNIMEKVVQPKTFKGKSTCNQHAGKKFSKISDDAVF
jgi:hypothetical protein